MRGLATSGSDLIASGGEDGSVKIWHLNQMMVLESDSEANITEIKTRMPLPGAQIAEGAAAVDDDLVNKQVKLTDKQKQQLNQIKTIRIISDLWKPSILAATTKGTLNIH